MSNEIEYKAIVVKEKSKSFGEKGVVKLLFIWDEIKEKWIIPDENKFKSKRCFITTDYSKEIDSRYKKDEPFILKKVSENPPDQDRQSVEHAEWRCFGNQNESLKGAFIPVIKGELPDQGYGELKTDIDIDGVQYIFIENGEFIYGPFEIFKSEKITAKPYNKPLINVENHYIVKLSKESLIANELYLSTNLEGDYTYIISFSLLNEKLKSSWEKIDYINNDSLLKEVLSAAKKGEKQTIRSKQEIAKVQADIKEAYGKNSQQERVKRALDLLTEAEGTIDQQLNEFEILVDDWTKSELGISYLKQLKEKIEKFEQEKASLEERVSEEKKKSDLLELSVSANQRNLVSLREEIKTLEQKKIVVEEEQKRRSLEESDQNFREKEESLKKIEALLEKKIKDLDLIEKLESLEVEERAIHRNIEKAKRESEQLQKDIKIFTDQLSNTNLRQTIIENNSLLKILKSGGVVEETVDDQYRPIKISTLKNNFTDQSGKGALIKAITKKLNLNDRKKFEEFEVANLLICVQQNLLTILQGAPGSGKTSTAISMAKALGLCSENESSSDHFLNIAVARGWVSSRDILGYYNSLKGCYQPAKTGLYQFLKAGDDSRSSNALRLVLLDEANLSPIEHYWSDFIGMCDPEGVYKSIDTGASTGQRSLTPNKNNNLRFLATINSDETTEPLSPRLLDRAPVINMDVLHTGFFEGVDDMELDGAVGMDVIKQCFDVNESKFKEINEFPSLNGFIELASKNEKSLGDAINLSMRKRTAISNYLSAANEIMDEHIAQDYAISQFLLPLFKGDKKGFDKRLNELKSIAIDNRFDRTKKIIDDVLERGDQYLNSYSFF